MKEPKATRAALAVLGKFERALDGLGRAARVLEDSIHAAQLASRSAGTDGGFYCFENLPADPITEGRVRRVVALAEAHARGLSPVLCEELTRARADLARTMPDEVARMIAAEATPKEGPPF